jgi:hypothetical protein
MQSSVCLIMQGSHVAVQGACVLAVARAPGGGGAPQQAGLLQLGQGHSQCRRGHCGPCAPP